jgi:hypothetical protein
VSAISHLSSPSLTPRTATPNISLSTSIHNNHLGMFASPIPPSPLSSVGGAAAPSATPSPFIGDSLFSHQSISIYLPKFVSIFIWCHFLLLIFFVISFRSRLSETRIKHEISCISR